MFPEAYQQHIDYFRSIVGAASVHDDDAAKIAASTPYREGEGHTHFMAVVDVTSVQMLQQLVKYCAANRIGIITQGGLTSLTKASIPPLSDDLLPEIIIRTGHMKSIIRMDKDRSGKILYVTTEPGITLHALNDMLKPLGLKVPIGLGIGFKAQMGGIVATNAGGSEAAFKGRPRSLVKALDVITVDGELKRLTEEDGSALQLSDFIGQEGITGIITSLTIRVIQLPVKRAVAFVEVQTIEAMHSLLSILKGRVGRYMNAFERIDRDVLNLLCAYTGKPDPLKDYRPQGSHQSDYSVLIELDSSDSNAPLQELLGAVLSETHQVGMVQSFWMAANEEEADRIWSYRLVKLSESIKERAKSIKGKTIAFDIGLPEGDIYPFPSNKLKEKLRELIPHIEFYSFGHAAGGGSGGTFLHFDPVVPSIVSPEDLLKLNAYVYEEISARGGTIAAEHGIGFYRCLDLKLYHPGLYQQVLARKAAYDPDNIFNPGKVVLREDLAQFLLLGSP